MEDFSIAELNKIIPQKLKEYRNLAGLSLKEVGVMLDMSASMISLWEQGKNEPSYDQLIKLCIIYKIELADLTSGNKIDSKYLTKREQTLLKNFRKADEKVQSAVEIILENISKNK